MGIKKTEILFTRKLSFRVTLLILIILSAGIGITISYYLMSENEAIIGSRIMAVKEESVVLYTAIKNSMLAGEAPVAVELFRDFSRIKTAGDIRLFRADGRSAFSDNKTLNKVNYNLKKKAFIPKKIFADLETDTGNNFKKAVASIDDIFISDTEAKDKKLIIYKPLLNQPRCSRCHGLDHVIRGVLVISTSVDEVYERTRNNTILSAVIYGIVVLVLSVSIILFLHRFVIRRIFNIGKVVKGVGEGDFKTKIGINKASDEIGALASQINDMIDGLNERFKLTKFVSKSTLDHIKGGGDIRLGGEKTVMTVLFSDIRGFTSFSENRDPAEVMNILNEVMNLQAGIVNEYNGDIDKFVGDELMAIFEGKDMVKRAAQCAERIIKDMKQKFGGQGKGLHVGIGINTGEMISGNMGSGERMDRTVIGDAVNLGSRLCSIAGKNVIVISEFSYKYIKNKITAKKHDPIKVKGKDKAVTIYTLRKTLW